MLLKTFRVNPWGTYPVNTDICKKRPQSRQCGQTGLMQVQLLLTQHFLAVAAVFMLLCSLRRGSRRSKLHSRWISSRPFTVTWLSLQNTDKVNS